MRRYPEPKTGSHTGWSPGRDRAAQARFRKALIERSGGYCEWVDPISELRCPALGHEAHHDQAGYTEDCGRFLCQRHHKAEDPHAR